MASKEYTLKWNAAHPNYHKDYWASHQSRMSALAANRRGIRQAYIDSLKTGPCVDCGGKFPPYCMDFDHLDASNKLFEVSGLHGSTFVKIDAEVAKCDLVCANCHRRRTQTRLKNAHL